MTTKNWILLILCLFFFHNYTLAQSKNALIIGSWKFEKLVSEDSAEIPDKLIEGNKGIILTFKKNGTFSTIKKTKTKIINLGIGKYQISKDEKYLIQEDNELLIITLNNESLIFRASENVIIKFQRL
jgi:Lipocalin-like domain